MKDFFNVFESPQIALSRISNFFPATLNPSVIENQMRAVVLM